MFIKRARRAWFASAGLVLLLMILAACGTNGSTSTGSPSAPAPTATATHSLAGTSTGCPNSANIAAQPAASSVVIKISDENKTTTVKKGDSVEVDLPFGRNWSGPTNQSQGPLAMQNPSGYASPTAQVCVWHFAAMSTGTTQLVFTGRPICAKNALCPLYIMAVAFPIKVQ